MFDGSKSPACKKKTSYIVTTTDGELIESLNVYRTELERQKLLLKTCQESEILKIQSKINNLKVRCIETIELLEEISHCCKHQRNSI